MEDNVRDTAVRRVGFLVLLAFVFVRFSTIEEILSIGLGMKPYLVRSLGVLAFLCTLASGGLFRCFRSSLGRLWVALIVWLVVVTPFSFWKGGSVHLLLPTFETEYSIFFLIIALALTVSDVHRLFYAIALSAAIGIVISRVFGVNWGERLSIGFGTLANPNDYATHLIVTMPFLLFVFYVSRSFILRAAALILLPAGIFVIFRTGSRGALLALIAMLVFILIRATPMQRVVLGAVFVAVSAVSLAVVPKSVFFRYANLFGANEIATDQQTTELMRAAEGSEQARTLLLKSSISLMLANPVLGVGPGQFAPAQADIAKENGKRGAWQVTHNSYTELGCEAGIPGLLLLISLILVSIRQLNSVYKATRNRPESRTIREMTFCTLLSLVGFSVCIFFASMEYRFYLPALVGLVIVLTVTVRRQPLAAA